MAKKVGTLIKEARTQAGLTQEALARKITGVSASDISKAERGEMEFTQDVLKKIAKACGVTQSSLLNAAKETTKKTTAAKKTTSAKATAAKKTTSASAKKSTTGTTSVKLTAAEKKLVELYREASSEKKKEALKVLQGEEDEKSLLEVLGDLLGGDLFD
ncbi:MAG: helix-turn-helix transcriptional regulator [Clostridia bacterium]|nr:helix-turn-helix transcriptional regulator [Clostridia bacterium]